jgi:hypothetical protein
MKTTNYILPLAAFAAGALFAKSKTNSAVGSLDNIGALYPNYHVIKVKYIGPTNYSGSRVKMISERFEDSKTIPYGYEFNSALDIAENWLGKNGYEIVGHAEGKDCYYVITNTFKGFKGE